ncbi:MAG: low molecular weight phosphotyrosine protein phosphatase [Bacteroidales bacterium]|nr:low molecular weight phosphotyrosine protein phosphatase [Bacteroidales bacterium]
MDKPTHKLSLLFICLGNICRSPAADGVMRKLAEKEGLDLTIDSAAIGSWHIGSLPDSRMRACGRRHGYDFSHRARQVSPADFERFDLVFGMDEQNLADLRRLASTPEAKAKIRLMADFLTDHPGQNSIPDPYYGDEADFEFALELIEDAARHIVKRIKQRKEL